MGSEHDVSEQNSDDVTFVRIYNATPQVMFAAMTTPEHLTNFWGPPGMSTPLENIVIDLRPGGEFTTIMVDPEGNEYPNRGVFVEFEDPTKIVWAESGIAEGMTNTITFRDLGDGRTEATTVQTNVPEMFRSPEALAGMDLAFDRMDEYVSGL